jgi:hypothetical protein
MRDGLPLRVEIKDQYGRSLPAIGFGAERVSQDGIDMGIPEAVPANKDGVGFIDVPRETAVKSKEWLLLQLV